MKNHKKILLVSIILIAAVLRLWQLPSADVITDEALNGFRSIGYIDFFVSELQTTPYDWLGAGELPGWVKLSFHDHPPLTFIIQNIFFKIGGVNLWTVRLPFALAGIMSVYLIYLIAKQLFPSHSELGSESNNTRSRNKFGMTKSAEPGMTNGETIGLISAGLLAINSYHVWVSRIALQESLVILLILSTVYLFLRSLENKKYLLWTGLVFGLALLSKYTVVVLIPILLLYLIFYKREYFKEKLLYLGSILSLVVFSPVILYNLKLYQKFGHFDFQLSYLLGQQVEAWQFRLGRLQAGGFSDKLFDLFPAIARGITPVLAALCLAAVIAAIYFVWKKKQTKPLVFILLSIIFYLILFIGVGPRERFVAMIVPFLLIAVAWLLVNLVQPIFIDRTKQRIVYTITLIILVAFIGYEIFFSINTSLKPNILKGPEGNAYSKLKFESLNWGYNELDSYLVEKLYKNNYPAFQFPTKYKFLEDIKKDALAKAKRQDKTEKNILIIYDENIHSSATVWYIFRPFVYGAWPFISAESYNNVLAQEGEDFFREQGVEEFILIKATDNTLLRPEVELTTSAADLAVSLNSKSTIITNPRVGEAFEVYIFK